MYKCTEKFTTREEVVKCTDEFHKHTENIKTNEDVEKGTEKLEDMKEAVLTILRKDSYQFEVQSKVSTGYVNLNIEFFKSFFLKLTRLI